MVCKIWLDNNGKAFGEGPYELLHYIEKTGSLHQAAMEMGLSYRKAWMILKKSEERLGFPLLERKKGGKAGGGSKVTLSGIKFMKRYEQFHQEAEAALKEIYNKYFEDTPTTEP